LFRAHPESPPDVDETLLPGEAPDTYVERVARAKAEAGWKLLRLRNLPLAPVLAADTTVALDNRILGKPADRKEAAEMLASLSGQRHEVLIERSASRGLVGNIYMGRVARVLPGMQSAFVEIGLERAAFLHVADIWEHRKSGNGEPAKPIEKILAEGEPLLVQVVKDPIGSKGARLSTQVSIAGRMLVYLPYDPHIGISQRIEDEGGRQLLRDRLKDLVPPE